MNNTTKTGRLYVNVQKLILPLADKTGILPSAKNLKGLEQKTRMGKMVIAV